MRRILLVLLALLIFTGISIAYGSSSNTPSKLITTSSVNMREGAGASHSIITTIPKGTTVSYGGKTSGSWYYIKYSGRYGWIHTNYAMVTMWESSSSSSVKTQSSSELTFYGKTLDELYAIMNSQATAATQAYAKMQKRDEPSMKTLVIVFCAGLVIGTVISIIISVRKIKEIQSDANYNIQRARQQASQEIAKVQTEINKRRELQVNLIKTLKVVESLNVDTVPDLSEGVVFVNPDLLVGSYYHHGSTCSGKLNSILISKKAALSLDMKPCPHCTKYLQPEHDYTVYITENNYELYLRSNPKTIIYHSKDCRHFGLYSNKHAIKLSEIKNSGRSCMICADCHPPLNNPTIWL